MDKSLEEIIEENKNLIYSISHYFENYPNKEDLFQVGVMGLITAYKNYDASFNNKFTTYAYTYILGEMKKFVREDKGIKISREITKLNLQIEKATILLAQKLMRQPTIQEIANYLEIDEYFIAEAMKSVNAVQSLDEPLNDNGKQITLYDTISEERNSELDDLIALRNELSKLPDLERNLIVQRYLNDMTQTETAKVLGMTQVQVSRKEQKVLMKLKDKLVA